MDHLNKDLELHDQDGKANINYTSQKYVLVHSNPVPVNPDRHTHMNTGLKELSFMQSAFASHGLDKHGSTTVNEIANKCTATSEVCTRQKSLQ